MVIVDNATAADLLSRPFSSQQETLSRLAFFLTRSLAEEGVCDEVFDTLEDILGDRAQPAPAQRVHRSDELLVRLGLPLPRRRYQEKATPMLPDEATRISDRFRRATAHLMQVVPHRVATYPTEELRLLVSLRDEQPTPDQAAAHLRRFAFAILTVLDLMGDDA
ncbi:hypothetical protein [Streptomyces sp. IB2014 016-6]|uniref:hypothetical protein n=1 Tax=Streptomyces sp. IB2014 016-6 TaxID=2517818 RepID=UPI0011CC65EB|nr:hypothetical protein [Streptomyces sp. IB2014 016-6]TXL87699.1 hypothetical protein EW053_22550 [Streptomyces sp. IB2014 016-6]